MRQASFWLVSVSWTRSRRQVPRENLPKENIDDDDDGIQGEEVVFRPPSRSPFWIEEVPDDRGLRCNNRDQSSLENVFVHARTRRFSSKTIRVRIARNCVRSRVNFSRFSRGRFRPRLRSRSKIQIRERETGDEIVKIFSSSRTRPGYTMENPSMAISHPVDSNFNF